MIVSSNFKILEKSLDSKDKTEYCIKNRSDYLMDLMHELWNTFPNHCLNTIVVPSINSG